MRIDRRMGWLAAALAAAFACGDDGAGRPPHDGMRDASSSADRGRDAEPRDADPADTDEPDGAAAEPTPSDAAPDSGRDGGPCDEHQRAVSELLEASSACDVDSDCAIVGACSGGFGFYAVHVAAAEEAQALSDATPQDCGENDGPLYHAVCQDGRCTELETGDACGAFHDGPSEVCPDDEDPYVQSCEFASEDDVAIATGCHRRCGEGGAGVCPPGFACEAASACAYGWGGGGIGNGAACTECEPFSAELCVPEPECEVLLSLDFSGQPSAWFGEDGALALAVRAHNLTAAEVTFSIPACTIPLVTGIDGYQVFEWCNAGCEATEPREFTLLPSERIVLGETTLHRDGSPCNPDGIANGTYTLTYSQPQLTGVRVCGPAPVELHVQ